MTLPYWLACIHLPSINPCRFLRGLTYFKNIEALFLAPTDALLAAGFSAKQAASIKQPDWQSVEADLAWAAADSHHLIAFSDPDYPSLLHEIADPPLILYVSGDKTILNSPQLAMVGARHASLIGLENARYFAQHAAKAGLTITSGLAAGIDGASHRGALDVQGKTIAVVGTGLMQIYPQSHKPLQDAIQSQGGAIVSEFPLHWSPQAKNFPRRNRIISGLSLGTLVVEAALKSGSLITVKHALEQGREVFAIPGSIHNPLAKGCHHLIRQGAKLVETIEDILSEFNLYSKIPTSASSSVQPPSLPPLIAKNRLIYDQIGYEMTTIDMIILRSGLTSNEVSSILLKLELNGYIRPDRGGYTRTIPFSDLEK